MMERTPDPGKPFELMSVAERIRFNTEIIGMRCGWPDLDAALALLDDNPGWSISYYPHGQWAFTDHLGRHEPGFPPGTWEASPLGDEYQGTGKPRLLGATVAELATSIKEGAIHAHDPDRPELDLPPLRKEDRRERTPHLRRQPVLRDHQPMEGDGDMTDTRTTETTDPIHILGKAVQIRFPNVENHITTDDTRDYLRLICCGKPPVRIRWDDHDAVFRRDSDNPAEDDQEICDLTTIDNGLDTIGPWLGFTPNPKQTTPQ